MTCYAKYLNFTKIWAKIYFAKLQRAPLKSQNLNILETKSLNLFHQIIKFQMIYIQNLPRFESMNFFNLKTWPVN